MAPRADVQYANLSHHKLRTDFYKVISNQELLARQLTHEMTHERHLAADTRKKPCVTNVTQVQARTRTSNVISD